MALLLSCLNVQCVIIIGGTPLRVYNTFGCNNNSYPCIIINTTYVVITSDTLIYFAWSVYTICPPSAA